MITHSTDERSAGGGSVHVQAAIAVPIGVAANVCGATVAGIAEDAAGDGVFDGTARTSQDYRSRSAADLSAPRCGPACPWVCGAAAVGYPVAVPATNHRGSGITDASPLCRSPGWQPQRHSASTIGRRRA